MIEMKKIKLLIIFNVLLSVLFNNTNIIFANEDDEIEPTAIIYCDLYKGKHKVVNQGPCNVYNTKNESLSMYTWGYYKCACGAVIFCSGHPDSDGYKAGIPEYYIETNISKRGKDWELYNQAFGSILKTDLPIKYKNTPLTAYDF